MFFSRKELVICDNGVGLALVHLSDPVGPGRQLLDLHGIILLFPGYKNNSLRTTEFFSTVRLQAAPGDDTICVGCETYVSLRGYI